MRKKEKDILKKWLERQIPRVVKRLQRIKRKEGNYQTASHSVLLEFRILLGFYYQCDKELGQVGWIIRAMATIFGEIKDYSWYYTKPTTEVSFLFLSNHKHIVNKYLEFRYPKHQVLKFSLTEVYGPMVITELLLRGSLEEAKIELDYWKNSKSYSENHVFYHQLMPFYVALLKEDVEAIEQSIHEVFTPDYHAYLIKHWHSEEKYFPSLANFCVKLSWMLGYEFQIEHPLIDLDIITMEPSQYYPTIEEIIVRLQELKFD